MTVTPIRTTEKEDENMTSSMAEWFINENGYTPQTLEDEQEQIFRIALLEQILRFNDLLESMTRVVDEDGREKKSTP